MENKTKPGEKGFAFVLLGFGIFVLVSAVDMYRQSPSVSSYGAMPLFLGILLTVFSLIIIVQNFRKESAISGKRFSEQASVALRHLFSKDVTVMILLLLLYSIALFLGAGFTVATSIYLLVGNELPDEEELSEKCSLYSAGYGVCAFGI